MIWKWNNQKILVFLRYSAAAITFSLFSFQIIWIFCFFDFKIFVSCIFVVIVVVAAIIYHYQIRERERARKKEKLYLDKLIKLKQFI
jgi:hypothetical protein